MIERGDPLFALKEERSKHVSLVIARTSIWKMKQITIERGNPWWNHDRTGRPIVCSEQASHPRFSRENQSLILEDVNQDRTVRPVVCPQRRAPQTRFTRDSTNFNLEDETNHHRTGQPVVNCDKSHGPNKRSQGMFNVLNNIDHVPSNVQFSDQESLLYVFEDNEAVIKMIIKGRSPTMRHVSRTHRVALDWLFDPINLDPKIQIKYIDTKNQLADILTKGNFTRDEWNHLCVFV